MAPNHKLTNLIKGRAVVGTSHHDGRAIVTFDDGSIMRIKTANDAMQSQEAPIPDTPAQSQQSVSWLDKLTHVFQHESSSVETSNAAITNDQAKNQGGVVKAVMQNDSTLVLRFEDDTQMEIALAEASSSVMLRDKDETMEYAD